MNYVCRKFSVTWLPMELCLRRIFHIVAWGVPGILFLAVAFTQNIEGDSLTGICYVKPGLVQVTCAVILPFCISLGIGVFYISKG